MKTHEKFLFVFIVIVIAFAIRVLYPSIFISPESSAADISSTASNQNPPLLVLPDTSALGTTNPISGMPPTTAASVPNVTSSFVQVSNTPLPVFTNQSYMVADLKTGAVLTGSNIAARWPTASITKLMTATVVFDNIATSTEITITPQMFAADPTEANIIMGDTYSVEDLLHLLLMPSSNVAAEAFADYFGRDKFLAEMNERAAEWGMSSTHFDDPSGISAANESSAADLMILAQHVYNNYPGILEITDTPSWNVAEENAGKVITIHSINVFAGEPVFIGGKTGNTPQAGGNLLSIFTYKNNPVLIVVLGAPALPFEDTSMLYSWFKQNFTT